MAKRPRNPKAPDNRDAPALVAASVTYQDTTDRFTSRARPDVDLIARAIGTLYNAADTNATVVSGMPLRLFRPSSGGGKVWSSRKVAGARKAFHCGHGAIRPHRKALALASAADDFEEVLDHPALDVIARPDPRITGEDWAWLVAFWQEMTGRCYLYKGERVGGVPVSLYGLAPQFTRVVGSKQTLISHYRYGRDTTNAVDIPPEDMIYIRARVHPNEPLGAISWPLTVLLPGDMEAAALQSEVSRWTNGGQPGGVIELPPETSDVQVAQTRAYIHGQYTGVNKAGGWMVLRSAKVTNYASKPHEMAYKDGLAVAQEMIYRAAGIPESVWKKNDANLASSLTGDRQYMGYTIWPRLCSLAAALTEWFLSEFPGCEGWWFAYDNPVKEDRAALVLETVSLAGAAIITGNEARATLGIEAGGEELDVLRFNGQPLAMGAPDAQGQADAADASETEVVEPDGGGDGEPDAVGDGTGGDGTGGDSAGGGDAHDAGSKAVPDPADALVRKRAEAELKTKNMDLAVDQLASSLRDWFGRTAPGMVGQDGAVAELPAGARAELDRIIDAGLQQVYRAGAISGLAELGAAVNVQGIPTRAVEYAQQHAAELVTGVTDTLRARVQEIVTGGVAEGRSITEIQGLLRDEGFTAPRAEAIARTESSMAYNEGQRVAWKDAGVASKRWVLAGGPCPICEAVAAQYNAFVPIDEAFYEVGDSIIGTDGSVFEVSKRDVLVPPIHPNCRCTLAAGPLEESE